MSPATRAIFDRIQSWPAEDREELADVAREINPGAQGSINCPMTSASPFAEAWKMRAAGILPPTKRWKSFINFTVAYESSLCTHGSARSRPDLRLHQPRQSDDCIEICCAPVRAALAIGEFPFEGRVTDEPNVRVVVAPRSRYLIFYQIAEEEVQITHIRHTSRRRPGSWRR